ncbi:MAG TPA: AlpA family phage regulatory protein [Burkholderiaceae bacterium]
MNAATLLRLPAVLAIRGRSRSATLKDVQNGVFTRPVRIGPKSIAWPATEVERLNLARIAGMTDDEIRVLVSELHAARKTLAATAHSQ